ncbi:hypothetical protein V8E51_014598 [Hyaloscypha variabilis]
MLELKLVKSLLELAEEAVCRDINRCVEEGSFASRYCCGGTRPIAFKPKALALCWDDPAEDNSDDFG